MLENTKKSALISHYNNILFIFKCFRNPEDSNGTKKPCKSTKPESNKPPK